MKFYLLLFLFFQFSFGRSQSVDSVIFPVYFDYHVGQLDSTETRLLKLFLSQFKRLYIQKITIRAYCDDRGGHRINDTLSITRAQSAYQVIIQQDSQLSHTEFSLLGLSFIELNPQEEIDLQIKNNRRADIVFYYSKTKPAPKSKTKPSIYNDFFAKARVGDKIKLKVYFPNMRHQILPISYYELEDFAAKLKASKIKIRILGHISTGGVYNPIDGYDEETKKNELSHNRAHEVYQYLIQQGIDSSRLQYRGMAGMFPTGLSPDEDRRVEAEVIGTK